MIFPHHEFRKGLFLIYEASAGVVRTGGSTAKMIIPLGCGTFVVQLSLLTHDVSSSRVSSLVWVSHCMLILG